MTIKQVLAEITKYEAKMIEAQIAGDTVMYDFYNLLKELSSVKLRKLLGGK